MNIKTVNVLVVISDVPTSITSFSDTPEGNKEAEELFIKLARENDAKENDIPTYVENGIYEVGDYQLALIHGLEFKG